MPAHPGTHHQQQSGNEERDEVPQQSREPERGHAHSAYKLEVLRLNVLLSNRQDGEGARQESYSKKKVDNKVVSFRAPVEDRKQL